MNGYLMQERDWTPGEDLFLESFSPENHFGVVFEDDGETAYFYAVEKDDEGAGLRILDALHVFETGAGGGDETEAGEEEEGGHETAAGEEEGGGHETAAGEEEGDEEDEEGGAAAQKKLKIVWSRDWMKCALVIDGFIHALFDFATRGGYNINEFPPPNAIWTNGDRKLTDELIRNSF